MSELVSVVIPIYNSEKYLRKCLDSIMSQTYSNLEIILLNDGSTDKSGDICKEYAAYDSRVKYIYKQNEGQSITRNRGIEEANGRYLYFMDSDDYVERTFIEDALNKMSIHNADSVIFNYYHVGDGDEIRKETDFLQGSYNIAKQEDRFKFFVTVFLWYKCGFEVWNRIYDANIIKNNDIRFPVFQPVVGEDVCFNLLYFLCAGKVYVSNDRYYYYAHNEGSTMDLNNGEVQIDRYNEISKNGYSFITNKGTLQYFVDNYVFIHILLVYHELMHYSLKESRKQLELISDKEYFKRKLKIYPKNVFNIVKAMGLVRGIKYTLLGMYYKVAMGRGN